MVGNDSEPKGDKAAGRTPALEWIASIVGLLLVSAVLAVIGHEALRQALADVPALSVRVERIVAAGSGYVVEVEVANASAASAAAVQIQGTLGGGAEPIVSQATLDYVPGHSQRLAGLVFREDPRGRPLEVRATGYQEP